MTLAEVVLPLRLPNPSQDLRGMLEDSIRNDDGLRYDDPHHLECLRDIEHLSGLRKRAVAAVSSKCGQDKAWASKYHLHRYYHCLLQCERRKIGQDDPSCSRSNERSLMLEWESAMMTELQVGHSLEWERVNLIWNFASMEAFQALGQPEDFDGYDAASRHLETAASWLHQISQDTKYPFPFLDFYPSLIRLWKGLLLAEAQHCAFQSHMCSLQPNPEALAEIAVAAVSMYSSLRSILQPKESTKLAPFWGQPMIQEWGHLIEGMIQYMKFMTAYYQAVDSQRKSRNGYEVHLLKIARREGTAFMYLQNEKNLASLGVLEAPIRKRMLQIDDRTQQINLEMPDANNSTSQLSEEELPQLTGSSQTYILPLEKILQTYPGGDPLFASCVSSSVVARNPLSRADSDAAMQVQDFRSNMDQLMLDLQTEVEENRHQARQILANVKLPHSLTAYQQEMEGGGIPPELWQRVDAIQQDHLLSGIKQELWALQDASQVAFDIHAQVKSQLDLDLESDETFRQGNPSFQGRNAQQLQQMHREQLLKYHKLLSAAKEGDAVLEQRAQEGLDTDPKFKLLHFKKSQLGKLFPDRSTCSQTIDVTQLCALILKFNSLFDERSALLLNLRKDVKSLDVVAHLQTKIASSDGKKDSQQDASFLEGPFRKRAQEIQRHMDFEKPLIQEILVENEKFAQARQEQDAGQYFSPADDCIALLEEAIEELHQITLHLEEGKTFYNNITMRLVKLRGQVDELSTKLTVERMEYDDAEGRDRQEEADALMARRLSQDAPVAAAAAPGVARGGGGPQLGSWVDDEKVATLVAMDFDPARAVEALKNQNNDMDAALNELLSSVG